MWMPFIYVYMLGTVVKCKKVFNFPSELIDNAIEISVEDEKLGESQNQSACRKY